jgi:hypothetical protein
MSGGESVLCVLEFGAARFYSLTLTEEVSKHHIFQIYSILYTVPWYIQLMSSLWSTKLKFFL